MLDWFSSFSAGTLILWGNTSCMTGPSSKSGCLCYYRSCCFTTVSKCRLNSLHIILTIFWLLDPFFPMIFLTNSWLPGMLDGLLQATFLCALLLFWLCIYHGLRQNERKFFVFYLPKLIVILPIWLCAVVLATWEKCNEMRDPTYSHFVDTSNYNVST